MYFKNPNARIVFLQDRLTLLEGILTRAEAGSKELVKELHEEHSTRIKRYDAELGHVGAKLVRRESEIALLADWLEETKAERDNYKIATSGAVAMHELNKEKIAQLEYQLGEARQAIECYEEDVTFTDKRYSELAQHRDMLQSQLDTALQRNIGLAEERALIEAEHEKKYEAVKRLADQRGRDLGQAMNKNEELTRELMPLRDSYANCKRESQQWYERWNGRGVELEKLTDENTRQVATIEMLDGTIKELSKEAVAAAQHDARQCDLISGLDAVNDSLRQTIGSGEDQNTHLESVLRETEAELKRFKDAYGMELTKRIELDNSKRSLLDRLSDKWKIEYKLRRNRNFWAGCAIAMILAYVGLGVQHYAGYLTH